MIQARGKEPHTSNMRAFRPRGLMDKASDFESEDCEFESRRGRYLMITCDLFNPSFPQNLPVS